MPAVVVGAETQLHSTLHLAVQILFDFRVHMRRACCAAFNRQLVTDFALFDCDRIAAELSDGAINVRVARSLPPRAIHFLLHPMVQ
jgi:hypothetical protein